MLFWHSYLSRRMPICTFPGFSSGLSLCALLSLFHARFTLKRSQPSTVALSLAMIALVLWLAWPPAEPE